MLKVYSKQQGYRVSLKGVTEDFKAVLKNRFIIQHNLKTELAVQYQRSYLGIFWALLNPLMYMGVMAIVFGQVLGRDIPNYPVFLFCGLVPFQALQSMVSRGAKCLIKREKFLKKMPSIKLIYPLFELLSSSFTFITSLVGVFIILLFFNASLSLSLLILPVSILVTLLFAFGLMLLSMTLMVFYRDFEHFIDVAFRALYFMTPVLLTPDMLGDWRFVMDYNPLSYFIELFRYPIYAAELPPVNTWLIVGLCTTLSLLSGYFVYKKCEHEYVFNL